MCQYRFFRVSCLSTSDTYGESGINNFIDAGRDVGIEVLTFQNFLPGATDISVEMRELRLSGARVFISFMLSSDFRFVLREAMKYEVTALSASIAWRL